MSKEVDDRVLSMEFDNGKFEKNIHTTINSLDKLKEKLNFTGAAKGFDELEKRSNKIDMSNLYNAVDQASSRFSALEIAGTTALVNLTNQAVNFGKRFAAAITIAPIKDGFVEYETLINSQKMIHAAQPDVPMLEINKALEELNKYADLTIYNFGQMTNAAGKFASQGVKIWDAVDITKGLSNMAAAAGTDQYRLNTVYMQLGQALSKGVMRMDDWRSFESAMLNTPDFIKAASDSAKKYGVDLDALISKYGSFRDTLKANWFTTDIIVDVFKTASDTTNEWGARLTDAATHVSTFTQLFANLKEALGTGWGQTFKLLIGDLEQSEQILTPISEAISGFIGAISDLRNKTIEFALGSPIAQLVAPIKDLIDVADEAQKTITDFADVANRVIKGEFGYGESRFKALTEAGYNYCEIQNKVNEILGFSNKYSQSQIDKQNELLGINTKASENNEKLLDTLSKMSKEEILAAGYTEEQANSITELSEAAKKAGKSLTEYIKSFDGFDGRAIMLSGLKNIGESLSNVLHAIGDAWKEAFYGTDDITEILEQRAESFKSLLISFNQFTEYLKVNEDAADRVRRTLRGFFSMIDLITKTISLPFKLAIKIGTKLLKLFGSSTLKVTAFVGDLISGIHDFIVYLDLINRASNFAVKGIKKLVELFQKFVNKLKEIPQLGSFFDELSDRLDFLRTIVHKLASGDFEDIGVNLIEGLKNGLKSGAKGLETILIGIAEFIINTVKNVLGIHSPSTVFMAIGAFIVLGLISGILQNKFGLLSAVKNVVNSMSSEFSKSKIFGILKAFSNTLQSFGKNLKKSGIELAKMFGDGVQIGINFVKEVLSSSVELLSAVFTRINFGDIMAAVTALSVVLLSRRIYSAIMPFEELGDTIEMLGKVFKSLSKMFKAKANLANMEAFFVFIGAIALLLGALVAIAMFGPEKLWPAVGVLLALVAIVSALYWVTTQIGKTNGVASVNGILNFVPLAFAVLILATTIKMLGKMSPTEADQATNLLWVIGGFISAFITIIALLSKFKAPVSSKDFKGILKIAISLLLIAVAIKVLSKISTGDLIKAVSALAVIALIFMGVSFLSGLMGKGLLANAGRGFLAFSAAVLILTFAIKSISSLSASEIKKGLSVIDKISYMFIRISFLSRLAGAVGSKAGGQFLAFSAAALVLSFAIRALASISIGDLTKGFIVIAAFSVLFVEITKFARNTGPNAVKAGVMFLALAVAIGILVFVMYMISLLKVTSIAKGIACIYALGIMMGALIALSRDIEKSKGTVIALIVLIALLTICVIALGMVDTKKLIGSTAAMILLMSSVALLMYTISKIGAKVKTGKAVGLLVAIAGIIGVLGGLVYFMSKYLGSAKSAVAGAAAISILLLALATTLAILSAIKIDAGKMFTAVGALAVLVVIAGLLGLVLAMMTALKVDNAIQNATALAILAVSLSVALAVLALAGLSPGIWTGILAIVALIVVLGVAVFVLSKIKGLEAATTNIEIIGRLLNTLMPALMILALIGPFALLGVAAFGVLLILIGAMAAFAVGLGALTKEFPSINEFVNGGIDLLVKLAGGIGKMISAFIENLVGGLVNSLPPLGEALSLFMSNIQGFVSGVRNIGPDVAIGAGCLASAIVAISVADFINGIASLLPNSGNLAELGLSLTQFAMNSRGFILYMSAVDPGIANGVKAIVGAIIALTGGDLINNIVKFLKGGTSPLQDMGNELAKFGPKLAQFGDSIKGINPSAMSASARAMEAVATLISTITGNGVIEALTGQLDMAAFGAQLILFGAALKGYDAIISMGSGIDSKKIEDSISVANSIVKVAKEIADLPVSSLDGETLKSFGTKIISFADALIGYSNKVKEEGAINQNAIQNSINASKKLVELSNDVNGLNGLFNGFGQGMDLDTFGSKLKAYGTALVEYSNSVSNGSINGNAIENSIEVSKKLKELAQNLPDMSTLFTGGADKDLEKFGNALKKFGSKLKAYSDSLNGVDFQKCEAATNVLSLMADSIKKLQGVDPENTNKLNKAIGNITSKAIDDFIKTFDSKGQEAVDKAKKVFSDISKAIEDTSNEMKDATGAPKALKDYISKIVNDIKSFKSDFEQAGKDFVQGLINGLSDKYLNGKVYDAAYLMGRRAVNGEREGQKSHSPSKEMFKSGVWLGEGLINGMVSMFGSISRTGKDLGSDTIKAISGAISKINSDIDTSMTLSPIITPVIDDSNVTRGLANLNSILSTTPSFETIFNARNAVSLSGKSGLGVLTESILDLKGNVNNTGETNYYNVNGIEYSDGSDVSEALKTIIRAAIVERRI